MTLALPVVIPYCEPANAWRGFGQQMGTTQRELFILMQLRHCRGCSANSTSSDELLSNVEACRNPMALVYRYFGRKLAQCLFVDDLIGCVSR